MKKTRDERFDEAFKMLLIIMSVLLSGSFAFYKEIMELKFFSYSIGIFAAVVILWTLSIFHNGKYEYFLKVQAWWLLMVSFGIFFSRLQFTVLLLPPLIVSIIVVIGLILTLPILKYLKEFINEEDYKVLRKGLPLQTVLFVILDVLYFLGFIQFPLR